ncbi:MAG: hypothetical protein V8R75_06395 [Oscillospiraceae bacterium]
MRQKEQHIKWGLTAFCTVAAILLFYDTLFGSRFLLKTWRQFLGATTPILYGAFMAYLLAPVVNWFDGVAARGRLAPKSGTRGRSVPLWVRSASILLTWALIGVLFYLLASVLLPELYKSVLQLASNVENYYNTISGWVVHMLETYPL